MASRINETMRMALTCVIVKRRDGEMREKEIYQDAVVLCLSPPRSKYSAPAAASDANAISLLKPSLLATFMFFVFFSPPDFRHLNGRKKGLCGIG